MNESHTSTKAPFAELKKAVVKSKTGLVAEMLPQIEDAIGSGVEYQTIVDHLRGMGIELTLGHFRNILFRLRAKRQEHSICELASPSGASEASTLVHGGEASKPNKNTSGSESSSSMETQTMNPDSTGERTSDNNSPKESRSTHFEWDPLDEGNWKQYLTESK
jgi:hypothetical protein